MIQQIRKILDTLVLKILAYVNIFSLFPMYRITSIVLEEQQELGDLDVQ